MYDLLRLWAHSLVLLGLLQPSTPSMPLQSPSSGMNWHSPHNYGALHLSDVRLWPRRSIDVLSQVDSPGCSIPDLRHAMPGNMSPVTSELSEGDVNALLMGMSFGGGEEHAHRDSIDLGPWNEFGCCATPEDWQLPPSALALGRYGRCGQTNSESKLETKYVTTNPEAQSASPLRPSSDATCQSQWDQSRLQTLQGQSDYLDGHTYVRETDPKVSWKRWPLCQVCGLDEASQACVRFNDKKYSEWSMFACRSCAPAMQARQPQMIKLRGRCIQCPRWATFAPPECPQHISLHCKLHKCAGEVSKTTRGGYGARKCGVSSPPKASELPPFAWKLDMDSSSQQDGSSCSGGGGGSSSSSSLMQDSQQLRATRAQPPPTPLAATETNERARARERERERGTDAQKQSEAKSVTPPPWTASKKRTAVDSSSTEDSSPEEGRERERERGRERERERARAREQERERGEACSQEEWGIVCKEECSESPAAEGASAAACEHPQLHASRMRHRHGEERIVCNQECSELETLTCESSATSARQVVKAAAGGGLSRSGGWGWSGCGADLYTLAGHDASFYTSNAAEAAEGLRRHSYTCNTERESESERERERARAREQRQQNAYEGTMQQLVTEKEAMLRAITRARTRAARCASQQIQQSL